jgi:hypothetical protein
MTATPAGAPGLDVAAICSGTHWPGCEDDARLALSSLSGSRVAICQYPDQTGDIVLLESSDEAEAACSADGQIAGSQVVRVVQLP